jgi:XapX domain-containing protein
MAERDRIFKYWVNLASGGSVATALRFDSDVAKGIEMKILFLSFIVGLGVGVLYGLIRVKSPAPPIVALLGLLGMVLGEQFGTWIHTKKVDVSRAASVCLVGERDDRPLYNLPSPRRITNQVPSLNTSLEPTKWMRLKFIAGDLPEDPV